MCFSALQSFGSDTAFQSKYYLTNTPTDLNQQIVFAAASSFDSTGKSRKSPISSDKPISYKCFKSSSVASSEQLTASQKQFKPYLANAHFLDMMIQLENMLHTSSSKKVYKQCLNF